MRQTAWLAATCLVHPPPLSLHPPLAISSDLRCSQPTPAELVDQSHLHLEMGDVESARASLEAAVRLSPQDPDVLDAYGALLAETGDASSAILVLRHAIELAPDEGHAKYLYLSQLLEGHEAIEMVRHGIRILASAWASTSEDAVDEEDLGGQLCAAYCQLAEHLMDSAINAEDTANDAEALARLRPHAEEIQAVLRSAEEIRQDSPEPKQVLASLLYRLGDAEAAREALRCSMHKWLTPSEDNHEEHHEEPEVELPSYEFRFECAKLLLELEPTTDDAIEVLESLVEEDDSNPHVWHLLSLAYYSGGHWEEAEDAFGRGETLLRRLQVGKEEPIWADVADLRDALDDAKRKLGDSGAERRGGEGG